jgi:spermidine/putrescine ABC transporter ATP-binding subunit
MGANGDRPDVDVRLQDVVIRYGDTTVVHGINLDIHKGEFLSLLGPSGCGKTTTLNAIAGFLDPSSGTISLRGRVVNNVPPHKRSLGMVFQSYALFPHMSVYDNVAFGLSIRRKQSVEIRRAVTDALNLVRLSGFEERRIRQLSGGQQQRVAIARALAFNPLVLLMDEPLSNLDAQLRRQMRVELRRIQRQVGITTIFVTHDQEEALTMSDRMVVMNQGHVEQLGTPVDLYRRPRTPFVAQFLGHPNFLYGEVVELRPGLVTMKSGEHVLVAETDEAFQPGQRVSLVLRAESGRLQRAAPPPGENSIPGTIQYMVYLGTNAEYEVLLEGGTAIRVVEQIANGIPSFQVGEGVFVTWSSADSIVLPAPEAGFGEAPA